jgi:hypothetical protein
VSEARSYYDEIGGCSCHTMPPCSFCTSLTEEESDARVMGGMEGLRTYWKSEDSFEEAAEELEL